MSNSSINLEVFANGVSGCPHSLAGSIPVFHPLIGEREDITIVFLPYEVHEVMHHNGDFPAEDGMGTWQLTETAAVSAFTYRNNQTGMEVSIMNVNGSFEVISTKEVDLATYDQLKIAGYQGYVDRCRHIDLICQSGHHVEIDGKEVNVETVSCPECLAEGKRRSFLAKTQQDADMICRSFYWSLTMGFLVLPVNIYYWQSYQQSGYRVVSRSGLEAQSSDLFTLLFKMGLPIAMLKLYAPETLLGFFVVGRSAYEKLFEAAVGMGFIQYMERDPESEVPLLTQLRADYWFGSDLEKLALQAQNELAYFTAVTYAHALQLPIWSKEPSETFYIKLKGTIGS